MVIHLHGLATIVILSNSTQWVAMSTLGYGLKAILPVEWIQIYAPYIKARLTVN